MSINGIQPLDLQTEHLDRGQYPSFRFLLLIAAIISSMLIVSWAAHRNDLTVGDPGLAAADRAIDRGAPADSANRIARIDRDAIARAIPLRP